MKKSISSDMLKWIAVITMLLDHMGAGIVEKTNILLLPYGRTLDIILRYGFGRLAFPIFCFLLIEGFYHTRSRGKYLCNLFLFAVLSEVPFEMLILGRIEMGFRNVYWTLAIGMSILILIHKIEEWYIRKPAQQPEEGQKLFLKKNIAVILVTAAGALLAEALHTDYGAIGVLLIFILYQTHQDRKKQCILGAIAMSYEITAPIAFLLIYYYNGVRKQKRWKYFFYCFYPLHLLLLYLIRKLFL